MANREARGAQTKANWPQPLEGQKLLAILPSD
jgi:hypothetical protein